MHDSERFVADTVARFSRLDALDNNAAMIGKVESLTSAPIEQFDRLMAVNVRGPASPHPGGPPASESNGKLLGIDLFELNRRVSAAPDVSSKEPACPATGTGCWSRCKGVNPMRIPEPCRKAQGWNPKPPAADPARS